MALPPATLAPDTNVVNPLTLTLLALWRSSGARATSPFDARRRYCNICPQKCMFIPNRVVSKWAIYTLEFSKKYHVISFWYIIQSHSLISCSRNIIKNIIQYHSQYHWVRNISFEYHSISFEYHSISFEYHSISFEYHSISFEYHNTNSMR